MVPQPHGGARRRGGTNRGGPGRPSAAWKRLCTAALRSAKGLEVLKRIISGDIREQLSSTKAGEPVVGTTRNADRIRAIELLAEHGHGLPTQTVEQSNEITIRMVKE